MVMMPATNTNMTGAIYPLANPFRILFSWEPVKAFVFLNLSLPIGATAALVLGTFFFVGMAFTVSVLLMVVGVPLVALSILGVAFIGHFERFRIRLLTGIEINNPYRELPEHGFGDRIIAFLSDRALWRDLAYMVLLFPLGVVQNAVAFVGVTVPLALIASPAIVAVGGEVGSIGPYAVDTPGDALSLTVAGLLLLAVVGYLFVFLARTHAAFARWLAGSPSR